MLPLPDSPTDPIKLADWLELSALLSRAGTSSRGDLERALRAAALAEVDTDEAIEEKTVATFAELSARGVAAGEGYPFDVEGDLVAVEPDWEEHPAYVFCLCLSYLGCKEKKGSKAFPRRWFEHISRDAAKQYIDGDGLRFASPLEKAELPVKFTEAVGFICRELKEGGGFKAGGLPNPKDDAVDVVAWKSFPDGLPGKLILFGNCATERDWEGSKRTELVPEAFCLDWMHPPPPCKIVKSLFIPHCFDRSRLLPNLRRAGIIFDRCRICYWTHFIDPTPCPPKGGSGFHYSVLVDWCRQTLRNMET